ncbi:MAG: hypothetical protein RLZZ230_88 [Candidatus Parcubacteria bacterium]|jgi:UDP-N-acetylmuramate dehydrogenase
MKLPIEKNVSLAQYTTLQVGGVADYFCPLTDLEQLPAIADFAAVEKLPILVLGGGSNMLVADGKLSQLVVKNELKGIIFRDKESEETYVTAAAGENWDALVAQVVERGLSGLENLSGIPGTVGAAPIQNINAYGTSASETIEEVVVYNTKTKQFSNLTAAACLFGYRDSVFKHAAGANLIVTSVTFRLAPTRTTNLNYRSASQSIERYLQEQNINEPTLTDIRQAILHVRKNIGMVPGCFRSAGSFFKNTIVTADEFSHVEKIVADNFATIGAKFAPWHWLLPDGTVKISTAFLMECTTYNKHTYGTLRWRDVVGLSPLHSLSIVTEPGATATDVKDFSILIIAAVEKTFKIKIETEVNFIE